MTILSPRLVWGKAFQRHPCPTAATRLNTEKLLPM
jgi:hypothetical protein